MRVIIVIMKDINPTCTVAWKKLQQHFQIMKNVKIYDLFNQDDQRFSNFSAIFNDSILVDYSKNHINYETIEILVSLAKECNLQNAILSMFSGEKINRTENRAVLHFALRNRSNSPVIVDDLDVMPLINAELNKMSIFYEAIIKGLWRGYSGKKITDIVNIGIGGSYLGTYMVTEALRPYKNDLEIHFISNVDGTNFIEVIKKINPETTLFLISSKSFTTQETITNASSVREWFLKSTGDKREYMVKHFFAISSNSIAVEKFGISLRNMFKLWDWVGGRFSLWSANALAIILSIGFKNFEEFLSGAYSMDMHFMHTKFEYNLPVILALISIWYNNFFGAQTEAILPYDQYMHRFPAYLQQINMESNGKNIDRSGNRILYQTGPIIWGETGTSGQHSFFQLIHQGTKLIPCDFIAPVISHNLISDHHVKLLANFFAQTETLAFGDLKKNIIKKKLDENMIMFPYNDDFVLPFKELRGNKPSNSILLKSITPYNLGALIALYEHKIFVQGIIFNIYTFDQWGIELGKKLASEILFELKGNEKITSHDSSTNGLINRYKIWRH